MVNLTGPALHPPAGSLPNLIDPPNNNTLVSAVTIVCLTLITLMVLLRWYTRWIMRRFLFEDYLMLCGYALFLVWTYLVYRLMHGTGYFVHQWNVRLENITEFSYVIFLGSNVYGICIACVKAALLIEWIRIFASYEKIYSGFFWCSCALIALNTMYYTAATAAQNLACTPYRYNWDKLIAGGGHCVDVKKLNLVSAWINLLSDMAIIALPQQVIWKLHMSTRKKIGVSLIFAAGIFGCVTAIARVIVTLHYTRSPDVTYKVSPVILWATGEMTSVFVVFCITAAPKAFKEIGPTTSRILSSLQSWTRITGRTTISKRSQQPPDVWDLDVSANKRGMDCISLDVVSTDSTKQLNAYTQQHEV